MKIERGTKIFLDTNVLLEATDAGRRWHELALNVLQAAPEEGCNLCIGTQVLREYLVVATRPTANNGLGLSVEHSLDNVRQFIKRVSVVGETVAAGKRFLELVSYYRIRGKGLHDLQILATAEMAGVDAILTANPKDFPKTTTLRIIPLSGLE